MAAIAARVRVGAARIGLGFAAAGMIGAAWTYAAIHLPAGFGGASPFETLVLIQHASAALATLGLAILGFARPNLVAGWLVNPAVAAFLALGLWSVAVSPMVRYPLESWLGHQVNGEGALQFLELGAIAAAAAILMRVPGTRRILGLAALSASIAIPLSFPAGYRGGDVLSEYLAPFALAAPVFAYVSMPHGLRRRYGALAVVAALPALVVAGNVTAWICVFGIGLPIVAAVAWWRGRRQGATDGVRRWAPVGLVAIMIFATAAVVLFGWLALWPSMTTRLYVFRVMWDALNSRSWFVGQGWGRAGEAFIVHLNASGADLVNASWDAANRGYLNAHNFWLEAILASGFVGGLVAIAIFALLPRAAERRHLPLAAGLGAASAALLSSWFFVAGNWSVLALAMGCLLRPMGPGGRRWNFVLCKIASPAMAVLFLAQSASIAWLIAQSRGIEAGIAQPAEISGPSCALLDDDRRRGGAALALAFRESANRLFKDLRDGRLVDDARILWFASLLCGVDRAAAASTSAELAVVPVLVRAELALDPKLAVLRARFPTIMEAWPDQVRHFLVLAPGRHDLAIPYLAWELSQANHRTVLAAARYLLARNAENPVGLWYSGLALIGMGGPEEREQGILLMRRAVEHGVGRFVELTPEIRAVLRY